MTEVLFERRHIALDRARERIANGGSDRLLHVQVGAIGSLAPQVDPGSCCHVWKVDRARRLENALDERRRLLTAAARRGFSKRGEGRERERPGERYTHRPTAPGPEPVGDERTADEVALGELATERQRELACLAILDADRDRDESIVTCELDQRAHVRESTGVFGRPSDESPRDLELVELRREYPARRVRDPNAIERDARARGGQARDRRTQSSGSKRLRAELEGHGPGPERSERFEKRVHAPKLRP